MNIKKVVVGELYTNCYIVEIDNECIIIDPGAEFIKIKKLINKKVVGCFITHSHDDHTGALKEILKEYNLELNKLKSDKFHYELIKNPGHTKDSVSYYFKEEKVIFCGDFIFYHSIGRTDLGGNDLDMIKSLKLIEKYPDDITLLPGHGPATTLGEEKKYFSYYY